MLPMERFIGLITFQIHGNLLIAYSCEWYGWVLGGEWLMATHHHTRGRVLVHTHSVIDTLLDVNICGKNKSYPGAGSANLDVV